ncbi:outer membrane lipoprotein carrier protein LolA [Allorhizobium sp. BGMRC 0089]|uniref:outer membrane lipoprotein carrier protein LolA n=1 Tax=Allorhizobium sonneratiae TaxID=2934936 RepID=UPI002033E8FB|nr:outer membrane lipoprotein carrier protein LolA [Allorhizobium sonneratiae]MCM2293338.1 outer membrane lipoprotein carrier protein LolA [Allorhizobium sonneratiae]
MYNNKATPAGFLTINRRRFLAHSLAGLGVAATAGLIMGEPARAEESSTAQRIADHFASVKTMMGEFVQFGPRGDQTAGKFYIERPGKLRFNYEQPSPLRVISDGNNIAIGNVKLGTWQVYPLSKTPLSLLLADKIDLSHQMVKQVKEEQDLTTIVLGDDSIFGNQTITLMFDPKTFELRQWTVTDAQGKDTSVMIFNVQQGVNFDPRVFQVPYDEIHKN